ncbi:hypothetical protein GPOL_c29030 [Gordonia polyisoprenivorans VH2]|uniref:Uncharacterized protein n=2 Tax=Gordonia polyisoprenivorans TaxID=84595 RepID=H6MTP5_GORPV|nr:hypothetical protein GPOL_c29030 [Gordonia polyisoprenivorans VH2]
MGRSMFERLSKDRKIPHWQQLALYVWAHVGTDGHCLLPADIARQLWRGSTARTDKLSEAVAGAVEHGWLDPQSNRRCAVVPHDVEYHRRRPAHCSLHQ